MCEKFVPSSRQMLSVQRSSTLMLSHSPRNRDSRNESKVFSIFAAESFDVHHLFGVSSHQKTFFDQSLRSRSRGFLHEPNVSGNRNSREEQNLSRRFLSVIENRNKKQLTELDMTAHGVMFLISEYSINVQCFSLDFKFYLRWFGYKFCRYCVCSI